MINIDSRLLSALDANEMYLLLNLTNRINGDRFCFPGNKTLCSELKWSKEKLQQVKRRLTEKKVIGIERRFKDNNPGQTSNIYRILTPQVGNYTPGGKNSTGEVGKLAGGIPETLPPSGGIISPPGVGKPGNEVLTNEVLTIEPLINEELKREKKILSINYALIFQDLINCIYPSLEEHAGSGYWLYEELESDIQAVKDETTRSFLKKIYEAARKIHDAFKAMNRPRPEFKDFEVIRADRKPKARDEAEYQIKAYADYCRLSKTFVTTDPEKLPERLIQCDWVQKLHEYTKPLIKSEKYDPAYDEENLHSQWLVELYYWQPIGINVCKRYTNRIILEGEEYLKVK